MKKAEIKQQIKSTALNAIRKIYHPKYDFPYSYAYYEDESEVSCAEQRECEVRKVIEKLEEDLKKFKL